MSEYQYYEFLAIDRPLSREQMAELRARLELEQAAARARYLEGLVGREEEL